MTAVSENFRGNRLIARVLRGSAWLVMGYSASQAMRLASNLILTRLLFPEAFGLMALVSMMIIGMALFSDMGLGPSVSHSKRGDDPAFLNTAWSIQVARGVILWLVSCLLAWPVSVFYGTAELVWLLPAAGLSLLIAGFEPTRILTAQRHMILGQMTRLDLFSQVIAVLAMIGLALALQSVWALILGNIVGAAARLILMHVYLPGAPNRLRWEPQAARELLHFGKWVFASTICGFFSLQGDKAVLGKALTLSMLGIYNIGYFLASFPILLGHSVTGRMLIPIYRETAEEGSDEAWHKLRLMRFGLTAGLMGMVLGLAHIGVPLVGLLYDPRYAAAGAIVVAIACIQIPMVLGMSYDEAALAAGNSRGFFLLSLGRAATQMTGLLIGSIWGGLPGALLGLGLAGMVNHPMVIALAIRHKVWDPVHDLVYALVGASIGGWALWRSWDLIVALG